MWGMQATAVAFGTLCCLSCTILLCCAVHTEGPLTAASVSPSHLGSCFPLSPCSEVFNGIIGGEDISLPHVEVKHNYTEQIRSVVF